jgi:hypothetical protein
MPLADLAFAYEKGQKAQSESESSATGAPASEGCCISRSPSEPDNRSWTVTKRIGSIIGAIGSALGPFYTISRLWPQISMEPTAPAEPSNPFSGYFKITNVQGYPLTDVSVEASLRCAKIGRGSDTSPLSKCAHLEAVMEESYP